MKRYENSTLTRVKRRLQLTIPELAELLGVSESGLREAQAGKKKGPIADYLKTIDIVTRDMSTLKLKEFKADLKKHRESRPF